MKLAAGGDSLDRLTCRRSDDHRPDVVRFHGKTQPATAEGSAVYDGTLEVVHGDHGSDYRTGRALKLKAEASSESWLDDGYLTAQRWDPRFLQAGGAAEGPSFDVAMPNAATRQAMGDVQKGMRATNIRILPRCAGNWDFNAMAVADDPPRCAAITAKAFERDQAFSQSRGVAA